MIRDHGHRANLKAIACIACSRSAAAGIAGAACAAAARRLAGNLHFVAHMVLELVSAAGQLVSRTRGGGQRIVTRRTAQAAFNGIAGAGSAGC